MTIKWTNVKTAVIVAIILICTVADAARDVLIYYADWKVWYVIKCIAFFPPMIGLWLRINSLLWRIVVIGVSMGLWILVYRTIEASL